MIFVLHYRLIYFLLTPLALLSLADILESFDSHPPLVLPSSGFSLRLGGEVTDSGLAGQLRRLQEFISNLSVKESPENFSHMHTQQVTHLVHNCCLN